MKIIDLFCGCGGLSLGFSKAGHEIAWACDNWDLALETYNQNFSHHAEKKDITDYEDVISRIKENSFDGIIGGPPCQDFSSAGNRKEGTRADLTHAYAKIIEGCRPGWFVMENVVRARTSEAYKRARSIFKKAGYGLTEVVLDASKCGTPQLRKRFICIGIRNDNDGGLMEIINRRMSKTSMTIRDYFGDSLNVSHYYRHPRNYNRRAVYSIDEPAATIRGVNRPIPQGYLGHPNDKAKITKQVRPLSTVERAMVQTFPENFIWTGSKTDVEQMIGNAVPVNLAKFIAECISEYVSTIKDKSRKAA